jgi:8-oxo-dGTP pyrophosphatase MutT (NUDIX family)
MKRLLAGWIRRFALLRWGLRMGVMVFVPRQHVGVVGAIFNNDGQVLVLEHVFRPHFPWGLPGGWINRGEDPALAVARELYEELGLAVEVKQLLLCLPQGGKTGIPRGLGLAYYGRLANRQNQGRTEKAIHAHEILSVQWLYPEQITVRLTEIDQQAVRLGKQQFNRETGEG